ncbi:MAG TPA: protoheme IX farnesyltransferase, partial [Thermodesulfobacteriota bacterium]|nr:protoheme IX farnesyltransferase [Thermodesulfobacteriota bacterium]
MTTAVTLRDIFIRQACSSREWVSLVLHLGKVKISLLTTLATAAGYLLATGRITAQLLVPTAAVFLLASGSCGLNQYQERKIDARMERTKSRPIASGSLNPATALLISGVLIFSGFLLLYGVGGRALALGLLAVLWYNLVYTPLKRKTAFAAVPGALVGAIPPTLGWVAGGGEILDPRIGSVALFFFIWQIPHFWLLLPDSSEDYEKAGLPSIAKAFSAEQVRRILLNWLLSAGVSSLLIPMFGLLNSFLFRLVLVAAAFWFIWNTV